MSGTGGTSSGKQPLNDVVQEHLTGCERCQQANGRKPVGLGQKSDHCEEYWRIFRDFAASEGISNNVVAQDEYGNQADKGGELW